jgi:hypothetical protein
VAEFSDIEASLAQPENQVITNFVARRAGPIRSLALVIGKDLASIQASAFPPTEQLDHELLTFEKPFDGLVDLLTDLAVPEVNQILSSSRAEIILFPPAGLHFAPAGQPLTKGTCLQQGKLNIVVSAHPKVRRDKLRIGAKLFPSTPPATRSSYVLPDDSWTESGDHIEGRLELEASDVPLAFAVLSYDGEFLGKWWIRDFDLSFNDRLQIHRSVDQASMLQSTFFDDRTDFEDRVNLLLALLGLQTLKYGQIPKLTEAPDILALSAGRHLYVIECTASSAVRSRKPNQRASFAVVPARSSWLLDTEPAAGLTSLGDGSGAAFLTNSGERGIGRQFMELTSVDIDPEHATSNCRDVQPKPWATDSTQISTPSFAKSGCQFKI